VVDLAAMSGLNEYNREIAERRLERVIDGAVRLATEYVSGVTWDGIVVALNGDLLSGDLHEELVRTNVAPTTASVTYWVPRLAAALTHLADSFGAVFVPCTDGNHDRNDMLRDDERITFAITTAPGQCYPIYDTVFHQSHGDAFRSAGGVGGIYPSMLKHMHRLDAMWAAQGVAVDVHLFGHWHQYLTGPNFIVNGSLKGFCEYARGLALRPDPARQALAVVTPERGIVQQMPVYAD
jgi:hypothetical protein